MSPRTERLSLLIVLIITIASSLGLYFYNRHLAREAASGAFVPRTEKLTAEIEELQQYVRINTTNPPGNEIEGARWLAATLSRNHITSEIIESAPGRANLYARLRGRNRDQGLLLLSHIDVVHADPEAWHQKPFAADIQLNMLWGRGSLDMKGIAITQLEAFLAVARKGTPERDVVFLATADEEQGSAYGMRWLLDHRPDVLAGIRYALNEGGITETRREELSYFGIEIGSKQVVTVRLSSKTREEMRRVRLALEPWTTSDVPVRLLPEVSRYFHDIAPLRIEPKALLTDVGAAVREGKFWNLPRIYRELLQNTVYMDGPQALGNRFVMHVQLLNLPDEHPDERLAWLQSMVSPYGVAVETVSRRDGPTPFTSTATPFFSLLIQEARREYGPVAAGAIILNSSINDSRLLRARGIDCYGVWPFPVDLFQTLGIHRADERIRIDWFMQGVSLMRRLVIAYAFAPTPSA